MLEKLPFPLSSLRPLHIYSALAVAALFAIYSYYPNESLVLDVNPTACQKEVRLGAVGEGGWTACDTFPKDEDKSCVVYSYGIRDDYSFDVDVEKRGCEVHGFDPSVSLESSYNTAKRTFHLTGIGPTGSYGPGKVCSGFLSFLNIFFIC